MRHSWICVDASIVVRTVLDPEWQQIQRLWETWEQEEERIVAPTLLLYEVTNALYQYQKMGLLSASATALALRAALALPIQLHGDTALHGQALAVAGRLGLSASYDAHYLALAERLGAELWTADRKLARKLRTALPKVHLVSVQD